LAVIEIEGAKFAYTASIRQTLFVK